MNFDPGSLQHCIAKMPLDLKKGIEICCLLSQGRLNEMMSQIRLHSHLPGGRGSEQYTIASEMQQEIRQVSSLTH